MKARPDETILAAGTHRSSPVAASAVAPHVAEHVVADLEVADFGVAVGLLAGAVFVDVTIGPVPAELRTAGRQLADQAVSSSFSGSRPASNRSIAAVKLHASGQSS